MAAPHVGHARAALELLDDTIQRGQPGREKIGSVSRAEEPICAAEEAVAPLGPRHTPSGSEGFDESRAISVSGDKRLESADHVHHAVVVRQHCGLFGREAEALTLGLIGHEA